MRLDDAGFQQNDSAEVESSSPQGNEQSRAKTAHVSGDRIEHLEGVVKWFDPRKGYGFIVGPDGQDIFTHYSVIEGDGFRVLRDGSRVMYSAEKAGARWKATHVESLGAEADAEVETSAESSFSRSPRR